MRDSENGASRWGQVTHVQRARQRGWRSALGLAFVLAAVGCGGNNPEPEDAPERPAPDPVSEAEPPAAPQPTQPNQPTQPSEPGGSGEQQQPETPPQQSTTPTTPWGTIEWVHLASSDYRDVEGNRAGTRIYAVRTDANQMSVEALSENGVSAWTRTRPNRGASELTVSAEGERIYVEGYDLAPSPGRRYLFRYFADGSGGEAIRETGDTVRTQAKGDRDGRELLLQNDSGVTTLQYGLTPSWIFQGTYGVLTTTEAAFDPSGNVVTVNVLQGVQTVQGRTFGAEGLETMLVLKFDPAGTLLWGHELRPDGGVAKGVALEISDRGTIVVAGTFTGVAHWAGGTYDSAAGRTFLLTMEPDGASRWFRQPTPVEPSTLRLALDRSGSAFVLGRAGDCAGGVHVDEINLAGEPVNTKRIGCGGNLSVLSASTIGHDLLIAGGYAGAVDFGNGTTTDTSASGGYLLRMASP